MYSQVWDKISKSTRIVLLAWRLTSLIISFPSKWYLFIYSFIYLLNDCLQATILMTFLKQRLFTPSQFYPFLAAKTAD